MKAKAVYAESRETRVKNCYVQCRALNNSVKAQVANFCNNISFFNIPYVEFREEIFASKVLKSAFINSISAPNGTQHPLLTITSLICLVLLTNVLNIQNCIK